MNKKVHEDNGRGGNQENGKFRKLQQFSMIELWKNIGCLLSAPTFGLGGAILWDKDLTIGGKKRKSSSYRSKVDLFEVCAVLFKILYFYFYLYTNTSVTSSRFVAPLTLGERSLVNIGEEDFFRRKTRINMSGGGRGC